MRKRFWDTDMWKWIRTILEMAAIAAVAYGLLWACSAISLADEEIAYCICTPEDHVMIRPFPNKKQEEGWLEPGDMVILDGKKKGAYVHCTGLSNESGEGWVHSGYLVKDKPVRIDQHAFVCSYGRLAARKNCGGRRTRWLKPMADVLVYYWSEEWCVTNCGYVQTKYLELEGE